eukprot:4486832-Prymnesium_polylepis.1
MEGGPQTGGVLSVPPDSDPAPRNFDSEGPLSKRRPPRRLKKPKEMYIPGVRAPRAFEQARPTRSN